MFAVVDPQGRVVAFSGRVLEKPQRSSIPIAAQEQLVVELYSK